MKNTLQEAKNIAIRSLARKSRFSKELAYKLQEKGFSPNVIQEVIAFCLRIGALNDEALQEKIIAQSLSRGKGIRWAAQKCSPWVSPGDLPKQAPLREKEAIVLLLEKKKVDLAVMTSLEKQKIIRFLLQRGFAMETILECMRQEG